MRQKSNEDGVALIAVLWTLLLLSGLAVTCLYLSRENSLIVHRVADQARAEAAADAAVAWTLNEISGSTSGSHPLDTAVHEWEFEGYTAQVAVTREDDRINLNLADDLMITALLMSQGIDEMKAQELLRDLRVSQGDDLAGSSERNAFDKARMTYAQRTHPLISVDALDQITSWRELKNLAAVEKGLTVYSNSGIVDPRFAIGPVHDAVEWSRRHEAGPPGWTTQASDVPSLMTDSSIGIPLRISVQIRSNMLSVGAEWIGRATGDPNNPVVTMHWSRSRLIGDGG